MHHDLYQVVSYKGALQRVRAALLKRRQRIRVTRRGNGPFLVRGRLAIEDAEGRIVATHVDLQQLGVELGCWHSTATVVPEGASADEVKAVYAAALAHLTKRAQIHPQHSKTAKK